MTNPTLTDLLERLKTEPQWRQEIPNVHEIPWVECGNGFGFGTATDLASLWAINNHNATVARLLAVTEVLSWLFAVSQQFGLHRVEEILTDKLSAALEAGK